MQAEALSSIRYLKNTWEGLLLAQRNFIGTKLDALVNTM